MYTSGLYTVFQGFQKMLTRTWRRSQNPCAGSVHRIRWEVLTQFHEVTEGQVGLGQPFINTARTVLYRLPVENCLNCISVPLTVLTHITQP